MALSGGGTARLHLVVGATEVKGMGVDDDAMSVMTGASGLSSTSPSEWQGTWCWCRGSMSAWCTVVVNSQSSASCCAPLVCTLQQGRARRQRPRQQAT